MKNGDESSPSIVLVTCKRCLNPLEKNNYWSEISGPTNFRRRINSSRLRLWLWPTNSWAIYNHTVICYPIQYLICILKSTVKNLSRGSWSNRLNNHIIHRFCNFSCFSHVNNSVTSCFCLSKNFSCLTKFFRLYRMVLLINQFENWCSIFNKGLIIHDVDAITRRKKSTVLFYFWYPRYDWQLFQIFI